MPTTGNPQIRFRVPEDVQAAYEEAARQSKLTLNEWIRQVLDAGAGLERVVAAVDFGPKEGPVMTFHRVPAKPPLPPSQLELDAAARESDEEKLGARPSPFDRG